MGELLRVVCFQNCLCSCFAKIWTVHAGGIGAIPTTHCLASHQWIRMVGNKLGPVAKAGGNGVDKGATSRRLSRAPVMLCPLGYSEFHK